MENMISEFKGANRFLSNFPDAVVEYEGITYPTVEHAYQAAKTLRVEERLRIAALATAGAAKRAGKTVTMRDDWDNIKISVMTDLVRQKFSTDPMRQKLLDTGDVELVEGNTWGDVFWGKCRGEGENHLGRILMTIRDELRQGAASV